MTWRRKSKIVFAAAVTVILAVALARMDLRKSWQAFEGVSWAAALGVVAINLVNTWIEALRWKVVLSSAGRKVRTVKAFEAILVGVLGNITLPLKLGDGARAYFLAKEERVDLARSFSSVVLDRTVDVVSFLALFAATLLFLNYPPVVKTALYAPAFLLILAVVVVIIVNQLARRSPRVRNAAVFQKAKRLAQRFKEMVATLRDPALLIRLAILGPLSWFMRLAMILVLFRAFHLPLPLTAGIVFLVLLNIAIAVVNTPGNVGGYELTGLAALKLFSVDTETAVSYTITLHVLEVLPIGAIGLVMLWVTGLRLRDLPKGIPIPPDSEPPSESRS
jgi:uncharacterized protein (TIRG00374 family)